MSSSQRGGLSNFVVETMEEIHRRLTEIHVIPFFNDQITNRMSTGSLAEFLIIICYTLLRNDKATLHPHTHINTRTEHVSHKKNQN